MAFPIAALIGVIPTILDKLFPDPEKANEAKLKFLELQQSGELADLAARTSIIKAEAESEHWLAAIWRPVLMLTFGGLIVARWFGWAAPNLAEAEYLKLWNIVELGLGGYVIGRSVEKVVPTVAEAFKNGRN
jgi:hypothetical protein